MGNGFMPVSIKPVTVMDVSTLALMEAVSSEIIQPDTILDKDLFINMFF